MLKIWYGDIDIINGKEVLRSASTYFNNTFDPDWLLDPFVREMIRDVDSSEVLDRYCIQSPIFGQIPPERLSGGVKTLILMLKDGEWIFNGSSCGNNCSKWLLEIGKKKDLIIRLGYFMNFPEDIEFEIEILNNHRIVHNSREFDETLIELECAVCEENIQ